MWFSLGCTTVRDAVSADRRLSYETTGLIVGFFLLSTAAAAYEIAPASVLPLVRTSLNIDATAASWLVSVMYATAVIASVPLGIVLDRTPIRWAMTAGGIVLLVAGIGGWYAAISGAYWWVIVSRVLGGIAYIVFWNGGANTIGYVVEPDVRATAVGIFTASAPAGYALGQFGSPLIAAVFGWPAIMPVFAAIATVGIGMVLATTREQSLDIDTEVPDQESLTRLFTDSAAWTLCILCFLAYSLYLFINTWLPSYLTGQFGISLAVSGLLTALFLAIGIVSRSSSGVLSDWIFDSRRRPIVVLSFIVVTPAIAGFAVISRVSIVIGLLVVVGFGVQLVIGLLFSYISEIVGPEVRTAAVSMLTSVGLLGAVVAPIVAGRIIDRAGYQPAFVLAGSVAVLGVILARRAPEPRIRNDA